MASCLGCSLTFPRLDLPECGRCIKKGLVPSSVERESIDKMPQCAGCGIVYAFLTTVLCGACIKFSKAEPSTFNGISQITKFLTDRVNTFQAGATQHRLNQNPPNKQLQAAAIVKEKMAAIRKQSRTESITVHVQIWCYPEGKKGAGSKAQLPGINGQYAGTVSVDHMFEELLTKAAIAYCKSPAYKLMTTSFERDAVIFPVQQNTSTHHIDDDFIMNSISEFFNHIKARKLLSDKDAKAYIITLRLYVYEKTEQTSEDDMPPPPLPKSVRRGSAASKRPPKRSAQASFGLENISLISASRAPRPSKKRAPSSQPKSLYHSSYRRETGPQITYDAYDFLQTICTVDSKSGTIGIVQSSGTKSMLVGQGWQSYITGGKPVGAYLSKGFSKYAFKGLFESQPYALFQSQPTRTTPELNRKDLLNELQLLGKAQFFLDSFYMRAKAAGLSNVPAIRWNFQGAFLGSAKEIVLLPNGEQDTRSLIFNDFLATPLLVINAETEERKFSGSDDFTSNMDTLGRFVDAYVHHVVCDSFGDILFADVQGIISDDGSLCLFDPQAHTYDGNSGYWDLGKAQIDLYLAKHVCNHVCCMLELNLPIEDRDSVDRLPERVSIIPGSTAKHPLHLGFD